MIVSKQKGEKTVKILQYSLIDIPDPDTRLHKILYNPTSAITYFFDLKRPKEKEVQITDYQHNAQVLSVVGSNTLPVLNTVHIT